VVSQTVTFDDDNLVLYGAHLNTIHDMGSRALGGPLAHSGTEGSGQLKSALKATHPDYSRIQIKKNGKRGYCGFVVFVGLYD